MVLLHSRHNFSCFNCGYAVQFGTLSFGIKSSRFLACKVKGRGRKFFLVGANGHSLGLPSSDLLAKNMVLGSRWSRYLFCLWVCLRYTWCFSQNYDLWYFSGLCLTKELTSQPEKCTVNLCSWNSLLIPCSLPPWKQLAKQNSGMAF